MLHAVPNGEVVVTSKTVHMPVTYFDAMMTMSGGWVCKRLADD
jgi:hypothetical protein